MRINYRLGFGYKKQTIYDFELIDKGRKIHQDADNDSLLVSHIMSRNAADDISHKNPDRFVTSIWTSGDDEYSSLTLDLAKAFANYIGDSQFMKFLVKYEKYSKDLYENRYKEQENAYLAYKDNEYYSEKEEIKKQELKAIESDFSLSSQEKKKKIVIKRREIKEIQIQANKYKKSFLNKYVNLRKKLHKSSVKAFKFRMPSKYFSILNEIKANADSLLTAIRPYDSDYAKEKKYYKVSNSAEYIETPFVISETEKQKLFEKLREQFYTTKTNSEKAL